MYKYTVIIYLKLIRLLKITVPCLNVEKYTPIRLVSDSIKGTPVYRQEDFFTSPKVSSIMYKI